MVFADNIQACKSISRNLSALFFTVESGLSFYRRKWASPMFRAFYFPSVLFLSPTGAAGDPEDETRRLYDGFVKFLP